MVGLKEIRGKSKEINEEKAIRNDSGGQRKSPKFWDIAEGDRTKMIKEKTKKIKVNQKTQAMFTHMRKSKKQKIFQQK